MKHRTLFAGILCILALLSGCALQVTGSVIPSEVQTADTQSAAVRESDSAVSAEAEFQAPLTDAEPAVLWGREQLSAHAQAAYDLMSEAIACRQETALTVDAEDDEIELILTALRIDHPEYFWFDGEASFVTTTLAGLSIRTECTFVYTMSLSEISEAQQAVQQYTAACLSSSELAGAETDYEKILGVYRYIVNTTDYVLSEEDQSIVSVMARGQATCAGYARTFQYLMNQLGIPCTLALGEGSSGESHGWNMVLCDGQWYQIDVTWGDPVSADGTPGTSIQYTYCLVTDEEIYRDHTLVSEIPMPTCTATACNYYIQEGRQFDAWDAAAYESAMAVAAAGGEGWFSVRFTTQESYNAAIAALFETGEIWDILSRATGAAGSSVVYTQNDLFYEISVQLG